MAVIPARKGSKRLPGKNTINLNGKPLIEYTFQAASASKSIHRIILTTDDLACVEIASKYPRIEIPFMRPPELCQDYSTDLETFKHVLEFLGREGIEQIPDILVHLRPTSPLRVVDEIEKGISLLMEHKEYDSVRSVVKSDVSIFKLYTIDSSGLTYPFGHSSEKRNLPDQLLPSTYRHVGYVDVLWTKTILEGNSMTGEKIYPFIIPNARPGINTMEDLLVYEAEFAKDK